MTTAEQILKNTQAQMSITVTSGDATGDVTYTVTDAAGVEIATGNATNEATPDGLYTFTLEPQDTVKLLTIVWTGTWSGAEQSITTYAEIVGGHLFTVAEARVFDRGALSDEDEYTDAAIREMRAGITDFFQEITGVSFIPRYARAIQDGTGTYDFWLPNREINAILDGSISDVAMTDAELLGLEVYRYGKVYRTTPWYSGSTSWGTGARRNVTIGYEHGYQSVPWAIHQAALTMLRFELAASDVSDRTISWSNELGTFRQAIAGKNYPTGIPKVDAALARYTESGFGTVALT